MVCKLIKMSKQINFTTYNEIVLIEYPGLVKNTHKMLETLGGIRSISRVFSGTEKRLQLHFHPSNPYNKSACGEKDTKTGLLLSVRVRRTKKNINNVPEYTVRIVGYCTKSIGFDNLCDFQYLPLSIKNPLENLQKISYTLPTLLPKSVADTRIFDDNNGLLTCLPESFARSDIVHSSMFRSDPKHEDGQREVLGIVHKSSYDNRDVVQFSITESFPTRPDPQIIKRMQVKYISDQQYEIVKKLFEECPIWTRIALLYESCIKDDKLKCITPSLAYYFSTGPWRTLYVRYGYDPRKDFSSRYYQTFDFRLRFGSGVSEFVMNRQKTIKKRQDRLYEIDEYVQDINYPYFEENKLPRSRQVILRYCDIRMTKVQEMLDKLPSPLTGAVCNDRTGWLPTGFDAQVRQIVSNTIRNFLVNKCQKEQIHAEVDSMDNADEQDDDVEEIEDNPNDTDNSENELLEDNLDELLDNTEHINCN